MVAYGFAQGGDIVNLDYCKGFAEIDTNAIQAGEGSSSSAAAADETPLAWFDAYEFPVNVTEKDVEKDVSINAPKSISVGGGFSPTATLDFATNTLAFNQRTYTIKGEWSSSNTERAYCWCEWRCKSGRPRHGNCHRRITGQELDQQ